jgi:nucleoid-associated protein YgaU
MQEGAGRIAGGLLLLIALWIGVYWWWPGEPKITYPQGDDAIRGVVPKAPEKAPAVKPAEGPPDSRGPAPEPPQAAKIIAPEFVPYTVRKGDTPASIAKAFYGSEALASVVLAANPLMSPQNLTAGRVIQLPKDPNNVQGLPVKQDPAPPTPKEPEAPAKQDRVYVVQEGDSLSRIAKEMYGDSRLASVIFEANRDQLTSEDAIKIGQKLKIPPRP